MSQLDQLKEAIKDLYFSVAKLHSAFPDRRFTPDGRMVGDIGEAIAFLKFHVILDKKSKKHWDGYRIDLAGKECKVQVKTTQKDETYLKKPPHNGDLIVFKIYSNGNWKCYYNGSIMKIWKLLKHKKPDSTGAKIIKLNKLEEIK